MDKRNKKPDRPKLRKEDIGTPVNFVHVQHVGFGGQKKSISGSQSTCTSPTFGNSDSFFNQEHCRRSDGSISNLNQGKENRFSKPSSHAPYSSMSNLSGLDNDTSKSPLNPSKLSGIGKQKTNKFSGSLLNLNFFPFSSKSSAVGSGTAERSGNSKSDQHGTMRASKRFSFGIQGFPGPTSNSVTFPPLPGSIYSSTSNPEESVVPRYIRRRSSSFTGESDMPSYTEITPIPRTQTLSLGPMEGDGQSKKPKFMKQFSLQTPPMSPSYDELPPPPPPMMLELPSPSQTDFRESPSYSELPPPPPMQEIVPRKVSIPSYADIPLPLPPTPPPALRRRDSDASSSSGLYEKCRSVTCPSPPMTPPPLPTSLPPPLTKSGRVTYKLPPLKAKLVRVNAPTLPPLSIPFVRPKSQSPGTPSTWPLEPGMPELYLPVGESCGKDVEASAKGLPGVDGKSEDVTTKIVNELCTGDVTIERIQQVCNTNPASKCISFNHITPISRLFQCRLDYKQWPIMMNHLFSKPVSKDVTSDPAFSQAYNHLIQSTLSMWLQLEGGTSTLDNVVNVFEKVQLEVNQADDTADVTQL